MQKKDNEELLMLPILGLGLLDTGAMEAEATLGVYTEEIYGGEDGQVKILEIFELKWWKCGLNVMEMRYISIMCVLWYYSMFILMDIDGITNYTLIEEMMLIYSSIFDDVRLTSSQ